MKRGDSLLRYIKQAPKGLTFIEIKFFMSSVHGMSPRWIRENVQLWREFGVIRVKGSKFYIDEERLDLVWKARNADEDLTSLDP